MTLANAHRRALFPLYLPGLLLGVPAQASLILLPLYVLELGGSVAAAAAVVGWRAIGMMAMDIPAGMLAARYGEKVVMTIASLVLAGAFVAYALCEDVAWFYVIAFVSGCGGSSFLLGRMSWIAVAMPGVERGRVIAMLAGSLRLSALLGPLAGGVLAQYLGYGTTFAIGAALIGCGALCLVVAVGSHPRQQGALGWRRIPALVLDYRRVFATAGVAAVSFMLMRAARTVLIPLIGAGVGLEAGSIGFIVALGALVDVALFYPAGVVMDRHGRRATAVPSSCLFALVLAAMALVEGYYSLLAAAVAAGVANGLSTGIVMTLGTDLAPPDRRGEFLGLWRLLTDFGAAGGPMLVSVVAAAAPLAVAALGVGALGACGSFVVYRYVEETLVQQSPGGD